MLHVPNILKQLSYVSSLCQTNSNSFEFFSYRFLVKDLKTRDTLLKEVHNHILYCLPYSINHPTILVTHFSSYPPWNHILVHLRERIMSHLISLHQIKLTNSSPCISCESSKIHKPPFTFSSIIRNMPLKLIYNYV